MRLLILAALIYLAYRAAKSWLRLNSRSSSEVSERSTAEIDDVMVKDPYCEVYFPKRNGVKFVFEDQELLFCSPECRDKFIDRQKTGKS